MSQPSPYPFKPSSRYSPPFAHQHQSSAGIGLLLSAAEMLDEGASFPYDNHQLPLLDTSAIPAFQSRYYPPSHQSPFQDSRFQLRQESSHYRSSTPLPFNAPTLPSQQQRTSSSWPGGTDRSLHSSAAMTVSRPQLGRRSFASTSIAMPSESLQDSTLSPSLPRTSPLMRNRPASLKRAQTAISCLRCRSTHKKCDAQRPCGRCVRVGRTDCEDAPPRGLKEKTSPRTPHHLLAMEDLHIGSTSAIFAPPPTGQVPSSPGHPFF